MATLKEHQAAMVDLLANGSAIPASASRLAHAMHDVINLLTDCSGDDVEERMRDIVRRVADSTTLGLNDKALSKREKAPKTDSPAKWPTPAEQRVKELENTIRQLKANNAKLKQERDNWRGLCEYKSGEQEQAGCRKEDTPVCEHERTAWNHELGDSQEIEVCLDCYKVISMRPV